MIERIEVDVETEDVTFFFTEHGDEPFSIREFGADTLTHKLLKNIENAINEFDTNVEV